jgi:hypothetical protein
MKNGLYSVHIHMLDGVKGRDSGILVKRRADRGRPLFLVDRFFHLRKRNLEGSPAHESAHVFCRPFCSPAVRRTGGHQRIFGDFRRRPGRGVWYHSGGKPKLKFSCDIEETRRYLMHCAVRGTQPPTACLNCSPAYISFQLPAMCNTASLMAATRSSIICRCEQDPRSASPQFWDETLWSAGMR